MFQPIAIANSRDHIAESATKPGMNCATFVSSTALALAADFGLRAVVIPNDHLIALRSSSFWLGLVDQREPISFGIPRFQANNAKEGVYRPSQAKRSQQQSGAM